MKKIFVWLVTLPTGFATPVWALETPYDAASKSVHTALGDVPVDMGPLVRWFFDNMLGLVGAIALLLMIFAAAKIITSAGNPNKIKEGQEAFASVIMGLVFILLSLFLLRFIGVDILHLPGLQ